MQLTNTLLTTIAILATTATALPSAGPLRMAKISGTNSTASERATAPGEGGHRKWPKISSPDTTHSANKEASSDSDDTSNCSAVCAISAQACVVALPDDESFWWVIFFLSRIQLTNGWTAGIRMLGVPIGAVRMRLPPSCRSSNSEWEESVQGSMLVHGSIVAVDSKYTRYGLVGRIPLREEEVCTCSDPRPGADHGTNYSAWVVYPRWYKGVYELRK